MPPRTMTLAVQLRSLAIASVATVAASAPVQALAATASGETLFKRQCATCHAVAPGETRVGPSLYGVVGRSAGKLAGFDYSDALRRTQLKWTPPALDRWLTDTSAAVPGSIMNFREPDASKRQAIIAYLASLPKK